MELHASVASVGSIAYWCSVDQDGSCTVQVLTRVHSSLDVSFGSSYPGSNGNLYYSDHNLFLLNSRGHTIKKLVLRCWVSTDLIKLNSFIKIVHIKTKWVRQMLKRRRHAEYVDNTLKWINKCRLWRQNSRLQPKEKFHIKYSVIETENNNHNNINNNSAPLTLGRCLSPS